MSHLQTNNSLDSKSSKQTRSHLATPNHQCKPNLDLKRSTMYIIGITGLSCSGKTTLAQSLQSHLGDACLSLSMDDYYKELTPDQYAILHNDEACINFDTPDVIDFRLLKSNLNDIKNNNPAQLPKFDIATCRISQRINVPANRYKYLILEGVFIFSDPEIAALCNLKIWIETSEYVCALRRFIKFTCSIKGYSHDYVYNQCLKYVIPGQEKYVKPVKSLCDFFINGERNEVNYVDMIVKHILGVDLS